MKSPLNPFGVPSGGGGTVNTGNAAVGDVANGKTFSSAALTNATGTSTKNATVPSDAPIQPAQAFVDCYPILLGGLNGGTLGALDLSNKGITSIAVDPNGDNGLGTVCDVLLSDIQSAPIVNLSGNNIADVEPILAGFDSLASAINPVAIATGSSLNVSGVHMGTPAITGVIFSTAGVNSDVDGGYAIDGTHDGKTSYHLQYRAGSLPAEETQTHIRWSSADGQWQMYLATTLEYTSSSNVVTPDLATGWIDVTSSGATPTVTPVNVHKASLANNGWTVTTN